MARINYPYEWCYYSNSEDSLNDLVSSTDAFGWWKDLKDRTVRQGSFLQCLRNTKDTYLEHFPLSQSNTGSIPHQLPPAPFNLTFPSQSRTDFGWNFMFHQFLRLPPVKLLHKVNFTIVYRVIVPWTSQNSSSALGYCWHQRPQRWGYVWRRQGKKSSHDYFALWLVQQTFDDVSVDDYDHIVNAIADLDTHRYK